MVTSLIALSLLQSKPEDYTGPRLRAAVSGFEIAIQAIRTFAEAPSGLPAEAKIDITEPTEFGNGMSDMLVTALIDTKRYVVLERKNLDDVDKELGLQKDAAVEKESTVAVGRLLGAQILVRGALTELSFRREQVGVGAGVTEAVTGGSARFTATATVDLKIIDVATAQILDSVKGEGKVTNKTNYIGFSSTEVGFGYASFDSSPVAKAIRGAINDAAKKIVARTTRVSWEARVASFNAADQLLYLNFGKDSNVAEGTILEVFRPGITIIDPQTREVIGREEDKVIGKCRIRTLMPKLAVAVITEGNDFQVGDGVRLLKQ
jgi:curli biogenesis system outer membrane secretion channel CsgG